MPGDVSWTREGTANNKHDHPELKIVKTSTVESDGSDVTSVSLPGFPTGLFVAMSDDRTFQIVSWEDMAGKDLLTLRRTHEGVFYSKHRPHLHHFDP